MRFVLTALAFCVLPLAGAAQTDARIHYLQRAVPPPPTLSDLDTPPGDLGVAGARLAIDDNATTGRFLGQSYALDATRVAADADLAAAARAALAGTDLLILDAPADDVLAVADLPEARGALIFNVAAPDTNLRDADCRANLLHTLPSTQMRTDALAQFFVLKKWTDLPMIAGGHASDQAFAASMERSLAKYGLKPGPRKEWRFDANMRRNASAEVPLFTQGFGRYDALIVADEIHDFGRYILYNTWEPRPVTGSEGLTPVGWDRVVEQWGAAQLQNRFTDLAARAMQPRDYAAWAAIRTLGEAVTRTGATDAATLRAYILSPDFELGGFLGRPLTFRAWNGQMRQPIPLVHPRALVAQAPLDGFLHPVTELDTIGLDAPESRCEAFAP
ncbi:ABC transporter substrate-binding protein [Maribius pontilimi]|uniref:ABC transporter substrate-binding protein n=1 Tax=Palleronia pontilimi TaxID=1964209 RepID=A0A934IC45_9RHOB|nr:ABC transporter substrate-binding protein [Palleronia pontilimi]MBJ3761737.1 ABC transporter substrate-binding protein [Palleronia pontilimi]